jgi:hypothetical protein
MTNHRRYPLPINIKTQKDVLRTEASMTLPSDLNELDQMMRASKATGKIIVVYNQGGVLGVNVEQNTRIPTKVSDEVRQLVNVGTRELGGE